MAELDPTRTSKAPGVARLRTADDGEDLPNRLSDVNHSIGAFASPHELTVEMVCEYKGYERSNGPQPPNQRQRRAHGFSALRRHARNH